MKINTLTDVLPLIEKPSRYLGSEINTIRKDLDLARLKFALAFPDLYEIGTSHFGMQILYHILNARDDIAAERVFAPGEDLEGYLRSAKIPLMSLESRTPLNRFDIIGFSLLYELNFTNILTMLDLAGIPFLSSERSSAHPLIIAGGPCTANPEPIAEFFDAIIIGDGEKVVEDISDAWLDWKENGGGRKETLLEKLSEIEGVYIPGFFNAVFDENGCQHLVSNQENGPASVTRTAISRLENSLFPAEPIIPYGKPVHDRLRIELARGCTRGCRFCQAGMIYRPVRERSIDNLLALSESAISATGYEELSLLSLSTGDYGCIAHLMAQLMSRFASRHIAVSLPSIRAGTLTSELMHLIKRVRKTGFTIAPEAGSQRLRDVINKNITEKDIVDTVQNAFCLGWQVIKLYFMIGLPTETADDLQAIVDLVEKLRKIKGPGGRRNQINVSVTTFIPKAHTPFQWAPQISLAESREKISWLKERLNRPGIRLKWQNPETSFLEGVWARGDRRLNRLLVEAYANGCRFDGWSDRFRFDAWKQSFENMGLDPSHYTSRERRLDDPLPWDHVNIRVSREFLVREWEKAVSGEHTGDCRRGDCNDCGVCDFDTLKPVVYEPCDLTVRVSRAEGIRSVPAYHKLDVAYGKQKDARFLGHLEMVNIFLRALRRAGIPIKYSEGYHPMPRVSFEDPIPLGTESLEEHVYLTVPISVTAKMVVNGLSENLPDGLLIKGCRNMLPKETPGSLASVSYTVEIKDGVLDEKAIRHFNDQHHFMFTRKNKKGRQKTIDLKEVVLKIEIQQPDSLRMILANEPGKRVRPMDIMKQIFHLPDEDLRQARIIKHASARQ